MAQSRRDESPYSDYLEAKLQRTVETTAALSARVELLQGRVEGVEESFRSVARLVKLQQNFLETHQFSPQRFKPDPLEVRVRKLEDLYTESRAEDRERTEIGLLAVQDQVESMLQLWNTKVNEKLEAEIGIEKPNNIDIQLRMLNTEFDGLKRIVSRLDTQLNALRKEESNDHRLGHIEDILLNAVEKMSSLERRTLQDRSDLENSLSQRFSHTFDHFASALERYSLEQQALQSTVSELISRKLPIRRSKSALGGLQSKTWTPETSKTKRSNRRMK